MKMTWFHVFDGTCSAADGVAEELSPFADASLSRSSIFLTIATCLLMAGCTVGPDFRKPPAPDVGGYAARPLSTTAAAPNVAGGDAQRFVEGSDIPGDWWTLFHSRPLNALIEQSLANNPDLKAAQAALSQARENVLAQRGTYYPSVSASFAANRQKTPGPISPTPNSGAYVYSVFTPQVSISYSLDPFGLNRRTVESVEAQAQAVRFQMIATHVTLSTNVVAAAVQEASLQAQIDATRQMVAINSKMLEILRYQLAKGYVGRLDVAAQESQLAQVTATLPPLLKQLAQQHDLLAVLVGRFPSQAPAEKFTLSSLQLPRDLPVSLPSALVAQRPDVLQAEANLHVASAQIGIATANRLPNIQLTADAGSTALAIGQVFKAGTGFWDLGAAITAPIFQGGMLLHQERAAVLLADTLVALDQDAEGLKSAAAAAAAAKVTLDLSQRQRQAGYASYLTLSIAEQADLQAQINLVQAQANRYADTAALFQALGGGWWHRAELMQADSIPSKNEK
jgi:NodT family efflux transporter outer membrane factor (OMF) lipoprotein